MRSIREEHLQSAREMLSRIERCVLDEVVVNWRHTRMTFIWYGQEEISSPGDVQIQFNKDFSVIIDDEIFVFSVDDLWKRPASSKALLSLIKKNVIRARINEEQICIDLERSSHIVVPLDEKDFEPIVFWNMRVEGDCLPL